MTEEDTRPVVTGEVAGTGWRLVPLSISDAGELQALFERSGDYFRLCTGLRPGPSEALTELVSLPPGASPDAKTLYGVRASDGELAGAVDVVRGWPDADTIMLGLLLLEPRLRGRGVGGEIVESLAARWAEEGFLRVRAGVVAENKHSARFFGRHGFVERERVERRLGSRRREVIVFVRVLPRIERAGHAATRTGAAAGITAGRRPVIVFDMDGTLLDSTGACVSALRAGMDLFDVAVPSDDVLEASLSMPAEQRYSSLLPPERRAEWERLREAVRVLEAEELQANARPFPGVPAMLSALRDRGYPIALVSDCSPHYFELGREALSAGSALGFEACTGEAGRTKAELAAEAVERLGGGELTLVGDRRSDLEAAHAAGGRAVLAAWGADPAAAADAEAIADAVIATPAELLELFPPLGAASEPEDGEQSGTA